MGEVKGRYSCTKGTLRYDNYIWLLPYDCLRVQVGFVWKAQCTILGAAAVTLVSFQQWKKSRARIHLSDSLAQFSTIVNFFVNSNPFNLINRVSGLQLWFVLVCIFEHKNLQTSVKTRYKLVLDSFHLFSSPMFYVHWKCYIRGLGTVWKMK